MDQARIDAYRSAAAAAAREQRRIQKQIDELDARRKTRSHGHRKSTATTKGAPVQTGARKQPANPLPEQHQKKPGDESQLRPAPNYEAPQYSAARNWRAKSR